MEAPPRVAAAADNDDDAPLLVASPDPPAGGGAADEGPAAPPAAAGDQQQDILNQILTHHVIIEYGSIVVTCTLAGVAVLVPALAQHSTASVVRWTARILAAAVGLVWWAVLALVKRRLNSLKEGRRPFGGQIFAIFFGQMLQLHAWMPGAATVLQRLETARQYRALAFASPRYDRIAAEYATEVDARGNGALARLIGALVAVAITPLLVVTFVVPWLAHGGVPWASTFSTFVETAATAISSALTMQWYLPLCEEGDMVRARVSEGLMRRVLQQPNAPTA